MKTKRLLISLSIASILSFAILTVCLGAEKNNLAEGEEFTQIERLEETIIPDLQIILLVAHLADKVYDNLN